MKIVILILLIFTTKNININFNNNLSKNKENQTNDVNKARHSYSFFSGERQWNRRIQPALSCFIYTDYIRMLMRHVFGNFLVKSLALCGGISLFFIELFTRKCILSVLFLLTHNLCFFDRIT